MLDDMFDDLAGLRDGPVWRRCRTQLRADLGEPLPRAGQRRPRPSTTRYRR